MKKLKGINLAIIILSCLLILTLGYGYTQVNNNKIVKNTYINGVDVSNLSKEEAKRKVLSEYRIDTIEFKYNDKDWKINSKDIDTNYNIDKTIDNAYSINRNKNIFSNIVDTLKSNLGNENKLDLVVDFNEDKLKSKLEEISKEVNTDMENAKLSIVGSTIHITEDKAGLQVDINATLNNLKKSLQEGICEEQLVVTKIEPEIIKKDLEDVDTLLGSYTTTLKDVTPGRVENIKIGAQKASGVLLMPGEEFSFNKHTGMRTAKNGYKNATVIVGGEGVQGLGGGICQVSTTLYNAVLYAGLDIVQVRNHSIPSSYADKGRDAAVSDSGLDFVFKNNYDEPVYIQNYYSNGVITCQVYGNNKDKKNIKIVTSVDKVTKAPTKEEKDPTLEEGKEKVLERGRDSYTVSTYRIYYDEKGKEIKREKVAVSFYPSKQQVVAIGTKKEDMTEEDETDDSIIDTPNKEDNVEDDSDNNDQGNNEDEDNNIDNSNNNNEDNINQNEELMEG